MQSLKSPAGDCEKAEYVRSSRFAWYFLSLFAAKLGRVIFTCLGGKRLRSIENVMSLGCMQIRSTRTRATLGKLLRRHQLVDSNAHYTPETNMRLSLSAPLGFSPLLAEEWKFFDFCLKLVSFINFPFWSFRFLAASLWLPDAFIIHTSKSFELALACSLFALWRKTVSQRDSDS